MVKKLIKRLGVVVNPAQLDEQDTFFLFIDEAIKRPNLEVFVFDAPDVSSDYSVKAKYIKHPLSFKSLSRLYSGKSLKTLNDFDLIFLKKDPPIDKPYERLLKKLIAEKIPAINDPNGILKMGTKAYLKHFPRLTPKTFYAKRIAEALEFIKKLRNCVIKKSDSLGGKGVKHIYFRNNRFYGYKGKNEIPLSESDVAKIIENYLKTSRDKTILITEYFLSAPKRGDKRVVVLDGNILGSYIRLPNTRKGVCTCADNGAELCDPTKRDYEIVNKLQPHLRKNGICLAALDLLVSREGLEHLSEINVFNPGFCNLHVVHPDLHIARKVVDMLCRKMV